MNTNNRESYTENLLNNANKLKPDSFMDDTITVSKFFFLARNRYENKSLQKKSIM